MSCPTCDHTMQKISRVPTLYWCPRCGTIKTCDEGKLPWVPALVERVAQFRNSYAKYKGHKDVSLIEEDMQRMGIIEAIEK